MRDFGAARTMLAAMLATTALASPGLAQEASVLPFPVRAYADENGVDLLSGVYTAYSPAIRIGSEEMGLGYAREVRALHFRDAMMGTITFDGMTTYTVDIAGDAEAFTLSGTTFVPLEQNGSTLTLTGSTYTNVRSDGTTATFENASYYAGNATGTSILTLTYPSGRSLTYHYVTAAYLDSSGVSRTGRRLQSVTTNAGYHMKFSYESDTLTSTTTAAWARTVNVKGLNTATDSCAVSAFSCPQTGRPQLVMPPPTLVSGQNGYAIHTYTDAEGRTTTFRFDGPLITRKLSKIRLPGSSTDDISISYTKDQVSSVTKFGVTTGYSFSDAGNVRTVIVTRPGGATRVVTFDTEKSVMLSDRDELNRSVTYQYDSNNRVARVTQPEGNYTQLTYDGRGNVTEVRQIAKAGSGLADIVSSASYDATCSVAVKCNRPNSTTDPRGNTTNYFYDGTHGGVLSVTAPAPTTEAVRPETRVTYSRLDSTGASSATGIFRPTASSTCQTGSAPSCVGTADEVKTTVAYGQGLLPSSVSQGAGDNSLTATTALTYDAVGNLLTTDGPLAGTADTTRYRYNLNREVIGTASPDPDGAGSLKHRAQRVTIDAKGLATKVEVGTVNSQSDADWSAFASLQELQQDYDANRRPIVQRLVSGATTYALSQSSYDSRGRLECVATRMNLTAYGSLPASACTLGTQGGDGPDRVTKAIYDAASQLTQVQIGVGTADQANEQTRTYSSNGALQTLADAENNKTTYEYDGHDRLAKTQMPLPTKGSNASSITDYEQLTYDAAGNVTNRRLRDGQNIGLTYDNLGRVTLKDTPGSEPDTNYIYDNLGRLNYASQPGHVLSFTYDALSRNLLQGGPLGNSYYDYDFAGRRTRMTYPGTGLYIDYDYLVTGETTKIRENGATTGIGVLATFAYDELGRRTSQTYGNGVVTSYGFDAISRLQSLTTNLAGTASDLTQTFTNSPAMQIGSVSRSNDAYAWMGSVAVNRNYTSNGLNQYTAAGPASFTYDARGNLTSDGSVSLGYSSQNQLISGPNGASLAYDPAMRLYQVSGATTTRFAYDGLNAIAEYGGSNLLLRRYVHGPGMDQPLVQYEGSDTATRRFLQAEERGSIIAVSDATGASFATNSYDEYGIPGSTNYGRFQYTGQMWLPELGLYYYKNRAYSPTLGRFLQTDPIDLEGGLNLYSYVGNDPINFIDPLGLRKEGDGCDLSATVCGPKPCQGGRSGWSCYSPRFSLPAIELVDGGGKGLVGGSTAPQSDEPSTLENIWECAKDQYGFGSGDDAGDAALGGARATSEALAAPIPKELAGVRRHPGTSPVTNPISYGSHRTRIGATAKFTGRAARVSNFLTGTARVASALGRANALTGTLLLLYDAGSIGYCTYQKSGD